jgi:hypothetical protein
VRRFRAAGRVRTRVNQRRPRRQPELEDRIRSAFDGPRAQYGDIFVNYTVWRRENETRLELFSGDPWLRLDHFTRSIVVRHLWRALEALAGGTVVVVDAPAQQWSKEINAKFKDNGVDPWGSPPPTLDPGGPQFARD